MDVYIFLCITGGHLKSNMEPGNRAESSECFGFKQSRIVLLQPGKALEIPKRETERERRLAGGGGGGGSDPRFALAKSRLLLA